MAINIKEETQIEQLMEMGWADFKAAMVEYKKRLDVDNLHLKAEIAKLEGHVQILKRRIAELEKEKEKVREIMGGKK